MPRLSAPPLCASPRCRIKDRHTDSCRLNDCTGCLPRQAADGAYLCLIHIAKIGEDALLAVKRYYDLGEVLTGSATLSEKTGGTKELDLSINSLAVELRTVIKHRLVATVRMVCEERGLFLPEDRVPSLGRFVARHRDWLSAHPIAGDVSDELNDSAHGRAYSVAYPSGTRKYQPKADGQPIDCPETVEEHEACPGKLWALLRRTDSLLPSALVCDHDDTHKLPASQWHTFGRQWAKKNAA